MLRTAAISALLLTTPAIADDYPPGPGTSGTITATGGVATGVFDFAGDVDAFRVVLPNDGRAFRFVVTASCHTKSVKIYKREFHPA